MKWWIKIYLTNDDVLNFVYYLNLECTQCGISSKHFICMQNSRSRYIRNKLAHISPWTTPSHRRAIYYFRPLHSWKLAFCHMRNFVCTPECSVSDALVGKNVRKIPVGKCRRIGRTTRPLAGHINSLARRRCDTSFNLVGKQSSGSLAVGLRIFFFCFHYCACGKFAQSSADSTRDNARGNFAGSIWCINIRSVGWLIPIINASHQRSVGISKLFWHILPIRNTL